MTGLYEINNGYACDFQFSVGSNIRIGEGGLWYGKSGQTQTE